MTKATAAGSSIRARRPSTALLPWIVAVCGAAPAGLLAEPLAAAAARPAGSAPSAAPGLRLQGIVCRLRDGSALALVQAGGGVARTVRVGGRIDGHGEVVRIEHDRLLLRNAEGLVTALALERPRTTAHEPPMSRPPALQLAVREISAAARPPRPAADRAAGGAAEPTALD